MKLGLIAMSGIRCYNDELTELGLTLPGFVNRNKAIASLPSLGLLTLAGMTPPTIQQEYLEIPGDVDTLPGDFDAVAISSFTARMKEAYALADRYRAEGVKVILGGLHVTLVPEEAMAHADAIVIGEGEPMWPKVMADLEKGQLKPVYDARETPFDFAYSPMPAFELLNFEDYNRLTVQTQRGCAFNCEFCASSVRICPQFKTKPVPRIIDEIRRIKSFWPDPFIEFADDNTFRDKKHGKALVRALMDENIKWFAETDVSIAEDEELVSMMRDAGCAEVLIGFESLSYAGLDKIEMKSNWKAKQLDKFRDAVYTLQKHGVAVNGCFVMGLDGTGAESFQQVIDFSRETGLFDVQVTILTPFPGTPLYERLLSEGRIINEGAWELCTLFDINFIPQNMTVAELSTRFRDLVEVLYSDEFTKARRNKFRSQWRAGMRQRRRKEKALVH